MGLGKGVDSVYPLRLGLGPGLGLGLRLGLGIGSGLGSGLAVPACRVSALPEREKTRPLTRARCGEVAMCTSPLPGVYIGTV